jgi:hypothetical protein
MKEAPLFRAPPFEHPPGQRLFWLFGQGFAFPSSASQ